jgi:hypothetical protein
MQQRPQHPLLHRVQQPSRRLYLYVANNTTSVLLAHPYVERRRLATRPALGTKNREPRTEPKELRTGTERTGTEKIGSYSVPEC